MCLLKIVKESLVLSCFRRSLNYEQKREYRDFNDILKDRLKNSELAIAYLNEALFNEDKKVFLLALRDVIEARELYEILGYYT
jgi:hypothetical protein